MKILVATNNAHKVEEIKNIVEPLGLNFTFVTPKELGSTSEPIEDGFTYRENALIKARYYHDLYHLPTIADDSGINIVYFNNYPDIHSSRFLGDMNYKESNDFICKLMKDVKDRRAYFNCCLAYIDENGEEYLYDARINGTIALKPAGEHGFGYDPIFCYENNTLTNAQLPEGEKNKFSHRYLVIKKWSEDVKAK